MSRPIHTTGESHCVFLSGDARYAVPAARVREVASRPEISIVPRSNAVLAGLCHAGDRFLPVLRLPSQTDILTHPHGDELQMLVIEGPSGEWGLLVQTVEGIEPIELSLEPDGYRDDWSTAVMGTATINGHVVNVLHPDGVYRLAEQLLKRDWVHVYAGDSHA